DRRLARLHRTNRDQPPARRGRGVHARLGHPTKLEERRSPVKSSCEDMLPLVAHRRLGVLENGEAARLEEHLGTCSRCHKRAAALETALDVAKPAKTLKAREDGWARLEAELAERAASGGTPSASVAVVLACTYCKGQLAGERKVHCAACLAPYHADCFAEHGRCAIAGCAETRFVEARGVENLPRKPKKARWPAALGAVLLGGLSA